MQLHLISDIHLEFADLELPGGEVLIIAGDAWEARTFVGSSGGVARSLAKRCKRFVAEELPKYKEYIYVPGNHEYYHRSIAKAHKVLIDNGLKVLQDTCWLYKDVAFYGTTLWTDANAGCPNTARVLSYAMNDFKCIKDFSVPTMCRVHQDKLLALESFLIDSDPGTKKVVVTHHAPSHKSVNVRYFNEYEMNGGYRSNLEDVILRAPNLKLWCHGHMHDPIDYTIGETRVVSNPRGYYGHEPQAYNYKPLEIIL